MSGIPGQPDAAKSPAGARGEEVPVGGTYVPGRGGATAAAQDVLAHHELAVVLADSARSGTKARIGGVGARRPLPDVADHRVGRDRRAWMGRAPGEDVVVQHVVTLGVGGGDGLPLRLGGELHTRPVRE